MIQSQAEIVSSPANIVYVEIGARSTDSKHKGMYDDRRVLSRDGHFGKRSCLGGYLIATKQCQKSNILLGMDIDALVGFRIGDACLKRML
jgi:hypothetical protein